MWSVDIYADDRTLYGIGLDEDTLYVRKKSATLLEFTQNLMS